MHVGYIGLGQMGLPMAENLLQSGCRLTVWNRTPRKAHRLVERGAEAADSPSSLAATGATIIFINLNNTESVRHVLFGEAGLIHSLKPGQVVVDNSTICPSTTADMAARLKSVGVGYVDAPVSGGVVGAQNGTLSIMVGGDEKDVRACWNLLGVLGKTIVHLGEAGSGQACKAANQIAVACNLLGACEALAYARKSNLPMEKVLQVLADGAANSVQLEKNGRKVAENQKTRGFKVELLLKDLDLALSRAGELRLPLRATGTAADYLRLLVAQGRGEEGTHALGSVLESIGDFSF